MICGRRAFSRVFEITESSEIGRKDVPVSLSGFSIGMMLASFHMCGMVLVLRARLNVLVRYVRPSGPMCLRCLMLMPSGPVELLFLLFRMAADISDVVSMNVVLGSL